MTPLEAVTEMRARIARGERCGMLFGRERNGLETDEVATADALVMIPVNSRFASLNLAQSVLILAYEWMRTSGAATLGRVTTYETPQQAGLDLGATRPATKEELHGFFDHIEEELERLGFFNPVPSPPDDGPQLEDDVHAHGADRAGSSDFAGSCGRFGTRQGTGPQTAISLPIFRPTPPGVAPGRGTRRSAIDRVVPSDG